MVVGATEAEPDEAFAIHLYIHAKPLNDAVQYLQGDLQSALHQLTDAVVQSKISIGTRIQKINRSETEIKQIKKDKVESHRVPILETEGTSLHHTLGQPGVDIKLTISNHVVEVFHTLGIEAARAIIVRELQIITAAFETLFQK